MPKRGRGGMDDTKGNSVKKKVKMPHETMVMTVVCACGCTSKKRCSVHGHFPNQDFNMTGKISDKPLFNHTHV